MNERIKQLAEQATTTTTSYYDGRGNVTETYFDKEKFAELIVRECANVAANHDALDIYEEIREYFGVEE
jgi:hypothetical protein